MFFYRSKQNEVRVAELIRNLPVTKHLHIVYKTFRFCDKMMTLKQKRLPELFNKLVTNTFHFSVTRQ